MMRCSNIELVIGSCKKVTRSATRLFSGMRTPTLAATLVLTGPFTTSAAHDTDLKNRIVRVPVLLELFTSEGCLSCPPADTLLEILDRTQPVPGADLIVLSEHVDSWDRLGWRDPFSSEVYNNREHDYTMRLNLNGSYTPELIVDGRISVVGSEEIALKAAVAQAMRFRKTRILLSEPTRSGFHLTIHIELSPLPQNLMVHPETIYVGLADDHVRSEVLRGPNAGRSLNHVAVLRTMMKAGTVSGLAQFDGDIGLAIPLGAGSNGLRIVAFEQDDTTGQILGVAQRRL